MNATAIQPALHRGGVDGNVGSSFTSPAEDWLMLNETGMETLDLYETHVDPGPGEGQADNPNQYDVALRTFDAYFNRQLNVPL